MKFIRKVSEQTARNPIARAVARNMLHNQLTDLRLQLYLKAKGDPCADLANGLGACMSVVCAACMLDHKNIDMDEPLVRVLRGGISTCTQLATTDSYDPTCAVAIDMALQATEELNARLDPEALNTAWRTYTKALKA